MGLEVKPFALGPIDNNSYLVWDSSDKQAIIIDPSFDIEKVIQYMSENQILLTQIWLTHAHFDHFIGLFPLRDAFPGVKIALHPDDLYLWKQGGLGSMYNLSPNMNFLPDINLADGMELALGAYSFKVMHTPGHSRGHVIYYNSRISSAFVGDLIFKENIGRTDLAGGSLPAQMESIHKKLLKLPPDTILYSGHGEQTTIQDEISTNPFI